MVEFLKRLRRLWLMSARHPSPLAGLIESGVLTIGEHTYAYSDPKVVMWYSPEGEPQGGRVRIGRYCSLADGVTIYTGGEHRTDWVSTFPLRIRFDLPGAHGDGHPASKGNVVIGNDVWIGQDATIFSGVTIGDGVVIGAHAVVAKDVPPYAVAVGNPARVIRYRFTPEQIEGLLEVAWWDWPDKQVAEHVAPLNGGGVDEFLARFR